MLLKLLINEAEVFAVLISYEINYFNFELEIL